MTTLGTPLSHHASRVMLPGSGELGKEELIALQRLGVETIAVERYDNAPRQAGGVQSQAQSSGKIVATQ